MASHTTFSRTAGTIGHTVDSCIGENPIWVHGGHLKTHIQSPGDMRCTMQMHKSDHSSRRRRRVVDYAPTAIEQMKLYCDAHPGCPSDMRHPQLFFRGDLWIALLGPNLEEGIVGIGPTIAAALRAFDTQYVAGQRLPNETIEPGRSFTVRLRQPPEC